MSQNDWQKNLGDWIPLGTRDGKARVGRGDSKTKDNFTGTPGQLPASSAANEGAFFTLAPGQTLATVPSTTTTTSGSSSIPFFNPEKNNKNGFLNFLLTGGQQNDDDENNNNANTIIHAPYFVSKLEEQPRSSQSRQLSVASNHMNVDHGSINNGTRDQQQWVAFAPIAPEEVQQAVASIVGAFPPHTLSRYSVERAVTARFNLGPKFTEPTVVALNFFAGSRENAVQVLHRHERGALYKGVYGDVKCALSALPPSSSLACGVLHPFSQYNHLRNNNNNNENTISVQLASQAARGNVSVCRKLEIKQRIPLKLQFKIWAQKLLTWNLVYVLIAVLFVWWLFF
jgi:hypothetical protein